MTAGPETQLTWCMYAQYLNSRLSKVLLTKSVLNVHIGYDAASCKSAQVIPDLEMFEHKNRGLGQLAQHHLWQEKDCNLTEYTFLTLWYNQITCIAVREIDL